jgi:hypothetical protein
VGGGYRFLRPPSSYFGCICTVLFPTFLQAIKPLLLFKACLEFYGIVYGSLIAVKMYSRPNSGGSFASFWLLVAVVYAIK